MTSETLIRAAAAGLLVAVVAALVAWRRAARGHRHASDALQSREAELATLHALAHELATTLDPAKLAAIVRRECGKLFDVDGFVVAAIEREPDEWKIWARSIDEAATHETQRKAGEDLALRMASGKRPIRIDDLEASDVSGSQALRLDRSLRSLLAVPLLRDDRVVGALCAQSRRPAAYDAQHLAVFQTIAQQAAGALEEARRHASATADALTGLARREAFLDRLHDEHERAKRYHAVFGLLMLDIDGFRPINERHGRAAGDRYLRVVASAIAERLRAADLACRYGGDEIAILLPETSLAGAAAIAERLRDAIRHLVVAVEGTSVRATVSIGVAAYPDHDAGGVSGLVLRADQALHRAKREGRDRVVRFAA